MDFLLAREFISIYQYAIYSQVKQIFESLRPDEDFGEITIRYTDRIVKQSEVNGIITSIVANSNVSQVVQVLSHFRFVENIMTDIKFAYWGRDSMYNLDIGVDLASGKVILYDPIQEAYAFIAKDEGHFLSYLRIYLEYTIMPIEIKNTISVRLIFRKKIIKAVGGNEYANYYRFIFPKEDKLNDRRVLEFPFKA